jgi:hypothetical protein
MVIQFMELQIYSCFGTVDLVVKIVKVFVVKNYQILQLDSVKAVASKIKAIVNHIDFVKLIKLR